MPQTVYFPTKDIHIEKAFAKNQMSFMHHHESYEIYFTISGEREYFIEDSFFKATVGDFVLIPKNMLHRTAGKGADRMLIYFSNSFLEKYFSNEMIARLMQGFEPKIFHPNEATEEKCRALLTALHTSYYAQAEPSLLAAYLFELLFILSKEENIAQQGNAPTDKRIHQILCFINENYSTINHIDEIAKEFYLSKSYLCRSFIKSMGVSLVKYLNTVKIRAACDLLQSGNCNMTEVALRCGFNSSAYFCKVFKQETGFAPGEYKSLKRSYSKSN